MLPEDLEKACRSAANAAVDFIIEMAVDYAEGDKEAGMAELLALLSGQREAVVLGAKDKAFQAAAETLDPSFVRDTGEQDAT